MIFDQVKDTFLEPKLCCFLFSFFSVFSSILWLFQSLQDMEETSWKFNLFSKSNLINKFQFFITIVLLDPIQSLPQKLVQYQIPPSGPSSLELAGPSIWSTMCSIQDLQDFVRATNLTKTSKCFQCPQCLFIGLVF